MIRRKVPNGRLFEDDTVVNVTNETMWVGRFRPLFAQEIQDLLAEASMFAIFDEIAQMLQSNLFR